MIKFFAVSVLVMGAASAQAAAPTSFAQCSVCHAVTKGAPAGLGPNLVGVYGRKAGSAPGYGYSPALKASKLVWTQVELDRWLTSPMKLVPGTKMAYMGQADAKKRAELVAYLKGLK